MNHHSSCLSQFCIKESHSINSATDLRVMFQSVRSFGGIAFENIY